jgi:hypothetical protein
MERKNTVTYNFIIPDSWSDITIRQYTRFWKSIEAYEDREEFADRVIDRAALHFCLIDSHTYKRLPIDAHKAIETQLIAMLSQKNGLELVKEFELDGVKYGFIPNLETMSYGEYLDLSSYSKSTWENLPIILSILYRPITERHWSGRYAIQPYKGTDDTQTKLFSERLSMDIAFGAIGFFLSLQGLLVKDTLTSLQEEMKRMESNGHLKQGSQENGDYIRRSLHLLQEIHSGYPEQQRWS